MIELFHPERMASRILGMGDMLTFIEKAEQQYDEKQAKKLEAGEITREDYDRWRYNYPKYDTTRKWVKVPSKELSDFLVEAFKDRLGKD